MGPMSSSVQNGCGRDVSQSRTLQARRRGAGSFRSGCPTACSCPTRRRLREYMIDRDAKIRSLVERNIPRKEIVSELDAIASDAESRAKRFERAKKKGDRYRAESERALSARVGQILFFLHHGVPAQGA